MNEVMDVFMSGVIRLLGSVVTVAVYLLQAAKQPTKVEGILEEDRLQFIG